MRVARQDELHHLKEAERTWLPAALPGQVINVHLISERRQISTHCKQLNEHLGLPAVELRLRVLK